jgi:hypothetical protein
VVYLLWYVGSVPPVIRPVITRTGEPASPSGLCPFELDQHAAGVEPEPGHLFACLVFFGDLLRGLPLLGGLEQDRPGKQQAAAEPVCLLLLLDITRHEAHLTHLLDCSETVLQDDVRQLARLILFWPSTSLVPRPPTGLSAVCPVRTLSAKHLNSPGFSPLLLGYAWLKR